MTNLELIGAGALMTIVLALSLMWNLKYREPSSSRRWTVIRHVIGIAGMVITILILIVYGL